MGALLKKHGHSCGVLIQNCEKDVIDSIRRERPDIIGFYCTTGIQRWVFQLAGEIKKFLNVPVIVGGPHPTFFSQIIDNNSVDFICRGEGEHALVELMNSMKNNTDEIVKIKNLWVKTKDKVYKNDVRDLVENLDELPFPDFNIYAKYAFFFSFLQERYPVITGRGCSYNCSFCYNHSLKRIYKHKGRYVRRRTVNNVIAELLQAKEKYKARKFVFVDDDFIFDTQWLEVFSNQYSKKIGLPFICDVRASSVAEKRIMMLKKAGCICVKMGVESGNEHIRRVILNKDITNEQIKKSAFLIKKYNISLKTCNILGIPDETVEAALETLRFNKELHSDFSLCSLLQPYPGTEIERYAQNINAFKNGVDPRSLELDESSYVSSFIKLKDEQEIINLQRLMHVFIKFHIPLFLIRILIKIPKNKFYYLIFKLSFAYWTRKIERLRLMPCIKFALHVKSYV